MGLGLRAGREGGGKGGEGFPFPASRYQIRNPKPEIRRNSEFRIRTGGREAGAFRISGFGFPSDFGFRS